MWPLGWYRSLGLIQNVIQILTCNIQYILNYISFRVYWSKYSRFILLFNIMVQFGEFSTVKFQEYIKFVYVWEKEISVTSLLIFFTHADTVYAYPNLKKKNVTVQVNFLFLIKCLLNWSRMVTIFFRISIIIHLAHISITTTNFKCWYDVFLQSTNIKRLQSTCRDELPYELIPCYAYVMFSKNKWYTQVSKRIKTQEYENEGIKGQSLHLTLKILVHTETSSTNPFNIVNSVFTSYDQYSNKIM